MYLRSTPESYTVLLFLLMCAPVRWTVGTELPNHNSENKNKKGVLKYSVINFIFLFNTNDQIILKFYWFLRMIRDLQKFHCLFQLLEVSTWDSPSLVPHWVQSQHKRKNGDHAQPRLIPIGYQAVDSWDYGAPVTDSSEGWLFNSNAAHHVT